MARPPLHLIIGNYNTSSWSLRAWLVLRLARLAFIETRIPLRRPETPDRIGQYSPSGKLPVLLAEGVPIWDSLAIAEFIAELEPGIWPIDPIARAEARAISAEVHSGFADLRRLMPMDVVGRFAAPGRLPRGLAADIRRVMTIFEHCRARFAPQGPFLFGAFSIADAMMAPIATRLVTHGVPMAGAVEDYVDSVMAWPDMVTWCDAAAAEQAEREAAGSLGVASITRPGRNLGLEAGEAPAESGLETPAATPSPAAPLPADEPAPETPPAEILAPDPAHAATLAAAPNEAAASASEASRAVADDVPPAADRTPPADPADSAAAETSADQTPALDAEPGTAPPTATEEPVATEGPMAAEEPVATPIATEEPVPAPRRRLFEPEPAAAETDRRDPARGDPAKRNPTQRDPAAAEDHVAPAVPQAERPPVARRLGWLRHGVPAGHLDPDGAAPPRRPAGEASSRPHGASERPAGPPAADQPRPRPGASAIKPIGGGILRRR